MPQTKTTWPIASKKLIDFGWHSPTPEYLQGNLARIEKLPFDGVSIKLPDDAGGGYVFDLKKGAAVKAEARNRQAKLLMALPKSKTLTHNFLTVHGTSTLDWFSDSDWRKAETQLRWVAQLAAQARLAGIVWDAEPYNDFPCWSYARQPQKDKYSFADYYKIVRQRGAQFIKALQEEFPGLTVLSLRQLSDFQDGSPFSAHLLPARSPETLERGLEGAWWGLHAAFTNGILDALTPETTFVDANEDAYYYTSAQEFERIVRVLKSDALALVALENRRKYAAQFQVGHAVSVDYTAGNWAEALKSFPAHLRKQSTALTPEQRAQWFEHNLYHALNTAEEFVWVYSEDMSWWEDRKIPAGYREAMVSARRKQSLGEPLGFEVEPVLRAAQAKLKAQK